jgi:hypothetical protein
VKPFCASAALTASAFAVTSPGPFEPSTNGFSTASCARTALLMPKNRQHTPLRIALMTVSFGCQLLFGIETKGAAAIKPAAPSSAS